MYVQAFRHGCMKGNAIPRDGGRNRGAAIAGRPRFVQHWVQPECSALPMRLTVEYELLSSAPQA